jgi:acetamidase/formamidase
MSNHHDLPFSVATMHWGQFDAALAPVLKVASGDTVTLSALPACIPERLPSDSSYAIPQLLNEAFAMMRSGGSSHFMSGPIAVDGAEPGDVLEVDILDVLPWMDWGYMTIQPLKGTIPEDFPEAMLIHPRIDHAAGKINMLPGVTVPLDPFFGVMGVAPPPAWGSVNAMVPRAFGGNMDNKDLRAGAKLHLPVFVPGALFSAGDGHGAQGHGEVCLTGLETGMTGTFRLTVRKNPGFDWPFAEDTEALMSIGIDEDLDDAAKQAVREMVRHVTRLTSLRREEAYMLASLVGDLHVTQTVDGNKGVHMRLNKRHLSGVWR